MICLKWLPLHLSSSGPVSTCSSSHTHTHTHTHTPHHPTHSHPHLQKPQHPHTHTSKHTHEKCVSADAPREQNGGGGCRGECMSLPQAPHCVAHTHTT